MLHSFVLSARFASCCLIAFLRFWAFKNTAPWSNLGFYTNIIPNTPFIPIYMTLFPSKLVPKKKNFLYLNHKCQTSSHKLGGREYYIAS